MAFVNLGQVIYPVGSIYISTGSTSPANLFGGSWTRIADAYLRAKGNTGVALGEYGGYANYKLSVDQLPSHNHASPSAYFIVQTNNKSMRTITPFLTGDKPDSSGSWRARLAEDSSQNPLPVGNSGGGGGISYVTSLCFCLYVETYCLIFLLEIIYYNVI